MPFTVSHRRVAQALAGISIGLGFVVFAGWCLGFRGLTSILPHWPAMNPSAAVAFLVGGVGAFALASRRNWGVPATAGSLLVLVGALKLSDAILGTRFGVDAILFSAQLSPSAPRQDLLAPNTALAFVCVGVAMGLISLGRGGRFALGLLTLTAVVSLVAIAGYLFGLKALYGFPAQIPMALHTGAALLVLAAALVLGSPRLAEQSILFAPGMGGRIARRLMIPIVLFPFAIGWLEIFFRRLGHHTPEFGLAVFCCLTAVATGAVALIVCRKVDQTEAQRVRAEAEEQHSRRLVSSTIDALSAHIAVLDAHGRILMVNEAWRRFAGENDGADAGTGVGVNYLEVCARAAASGVPEARALHDAIAAVIAGRRVTFELEYPCHGPNLPRWFLVRVTRLPALEDQVVVAHENITNLRRAVDALQETERRFRSAFEYSGIGMALVSLQGRFMSVNRALCEIVGYSETELTQMTFQQLTHAEDLRNDLQHAHALLRGEIRSYQIEKRYVHKSGRLVPILLCGSSVRDAAGKTLYFIAQVQDISAQKAAAAERDRFFTLSLDLLCIAGADGHFKRVNPAFRETLGWSEEELLARPMFEFIHPDDQARTRLQLEKMTQTDRPTVNFQNRYRCRDGSYRWLSWSSRPYPAEALVYAVARDVTRERTDHSRLLQSLQQKDILLREVHHRVKNNLQVMSSLLQLQARHARNPAVEKLFAESQSRLRAMSLLHEKLYGQEDMAAIDLAEYIPGLVRTLGQSLGTVELRVEVAPRMVSIETALPLGLIINELVSNAFKHAMPRTERGWVAVTLQPQGQRLVLTVADNGPGLAPGLDLTKLESLGLKLVTLLSAQLGGTPAWSSQAGLRFQLEFDVADSSLQNDAPPAPILP